jgi:succinylglutamate desuccinylase
MGGVHGDEPCGIKVLEYIENNINLISGKLYLIYGNPRAIEQKVRQTDINLNRIFRNDNQISEKEKMTYEYNRSREIIRYLDKSDVLFDIHSSSIKGTEPFVICEPRCADIFKYFPVPFSCSGFDDIEPGSTDYYMSLSGENGICIECGYNGNEETKQVGIECIEISLALLGMIDGNIEQVVNKKQKRLKAVCLYKTKTDNFRLVKEFDNFEPIKKGQHIATDGDKKIFSDSNQFILFAHNCDKKGEEGFILLKD